MGWEICQKPHGIINSQTPYTADLLTKHGLGHANRVWTALPTNADLGKTHWSDRRLVSAEHSKYRSSIGALLYLAVCTRPDVSFAVCILARNVHDLMEKAT